MWLNHSTSRASVILAFCFILAFAGDLTGQGRQEFGAAVIRPLGSGERQYKELKIDGVRLSARAASLRYLITEAFAIEDYQLAGTARWMDEDLYTVTATIPISSDREQVMAMLRDLLAKEFHLKTHFATKPTKVYELVVAKGGSKLRPLPDGEEPPRVSALTSAGQMVVSVGSTLPELVRYLNTRTGAASLGWPVVDRTGMKGRYSILLTYDNKPSNDGVPGGTLNIDYLSALPRELGLSLKATTADCSFLVVDSATKPELP